MQFWVDERPGIPCCRFATAEELETDPEQYDCSTCQVSAALIDLKPENREAWRMYEAVVSRFTCETHCVSTLLGRALRDLDTDEAADLVARLALIYSEVVPIVVQKTDH